MVDEFYIKLETEISKYSTNEQEKEEIFSSQQEEVTKNKYDEDVERNITKQLTEFNNPFLLKAFEDYLPPELLKRNNSDDINIPKIQNIKIETNIFKRFIFKILIIIYIINSNKFSYKNYFVKYKILYFRLEKVSNYILPFRKILENILADILISRYNGASKLVKNIMSEEYKLELHLMLMRSVYMMEAGHIMNKFYQRLFHEVYYKYKIFNI